MVDKKPAYRHDCVGAGRSETLPGYQILGKLGAGGMGIVFKALEVKNNRLVAIKILYPKTDCNTSLFHSFQRESSLLIKFNHPNIVKGYYVSPPEGINGIHFSVMEYVEGESVQQLIDQTHSTNPDYALRSAPHSTSGFSEQEPGTGK